MDRLWSPWRSQYIQSFGTAEEYRGCVFCDVANAGEDDAHYIVRRHDHCFTVLNLYPYNSGHLLIVPYAHIDNYHDLEDAAYAELFGLVRTWLSVLRDTMRPQGFNIGSNIGRIAGAGIDRHVHMHIVPRWNGDVNFMPVVADTRVISESMEDTMLKLRAGFDIQAQHTM